MYTKAFVWLLLGMLVVGGSIGGAFIGGIALGKSQEAEAAQDAPVAAPAASLAQQPADGQGLASPDQFRQRFQSGDLSEDELEQFRQQFQGAQGGEFGAQGGRGFTGGAFGGRGGLSGTIESIDGSTVTVNTTQGPLQATVTEDTTIQQIAEVTLADLLTGMQVTVTGAPGDDGAVEAATILITPEGASGLFGGGGFQGGFNQQD